jgi:glycosyltransferase involved in cell wall biosynthesis
LKIGVITSAYPEFEDDPHGIFVHRLMKEIVKKGHDVQVLAPYTGGEIKYSLQGVSVERFNYFYPKKFQMLCGRSGMIDNVKEGYLVKFQVLTFLIFNLINSMKKFRDRDLIHVQWAIPNGLGALILKKIWGIPYINTVFGEEIYLSDRYHFNPILKVLINESEKSIAISSETLKNSLDMGFQEEQFEIVPFGVDINFFKNKNVSKDKNKFIILSVGYLIERKGFEYLIKSMKYVVKEANVELRIIGSGPMEKKLDNLIRELRLEETVKIRKNVSDEELLELYNLSDLFILPSIIDSQGNTEGLGVVILEAMACGLPVIGSNVGGIPDIIINNETGLLVPPKNEFELSKAIINLISNEDIRKKLAKNGYNQVIEKFTWEKISESYIKLYEQCIIKDI